MRPRRVLDRQGGGRRKGRDRGVGERVPLGYADVPESCSSRTLGSIDSLPTSRPGAVKSADIASIYAPHLKVFRQ